MVTSGVANPLEGIGFGAAVDYLGLEVDRWCGVFLLRRQHGSRQRGAAGVRCGYGGRTCAGRWTLPGVVVTPSVRPTKFMRILTLKIDRRFEGGDGFSGVCKGACWESVSSTLSLLLECVSEFAMGPGHLSSL